MIVLMWILNFAISWANAWGCGKTWNETRHSGGVPHFMNWMGAIMSACGFSWCYMVVIANAAAAITVDGENGAPAHALLPPVVADGVTSLVYLAIILPVLGSGIAITVHAWGVAYRERNLGSAAVAAYDTWAQVYNMRGAMRYVPEAAGNVSSIFSSDSDDSDGNWGLLVLALAAAVLVGGVLTTRAIVRSTARSTALGRSLGAPGR